MTVRPQNLALNDRIECSMNGLDQIHKYDPFASFSPLQRNVWLETSSKSRLTRNSISDETKHRIRELEQQSVRDRAARNADYPNNGYRNRELEHKVRRALRAEVDKVKHDRGYEARARPTRGVRESLKGMMFLIRMGLLGERAPKGETSDALRPILRRENGGRGQIAGRSAK